MENDGNRMEGSQVSLKRSRTDFEDNDPTEDDFEDSEVVDSEEIDWSSDEGSRDDSEEIHCEEDIEEHDYILAHDVNQRVKIRLFLCDEYHPSKWMKTFLATCTCNGIVVATALARYIDREAVRDRFWEKMEKPSREMRDMAFHVFNRYGTVKTKYKDHPVQRGTGVWGNEIEHGPLFLFEQVHVAAVELRRKGLGQKVVTLLLEKGKKFWLDGKPDSEDADLFYGSREAFERAWTLHALVSPGIPTADIESLLVGKSAEERLMIRTQIQSGALDFWRSCGFRRIGASRCFALSFNPQHQSCTLAAASDFNPRRSNAEDLEDEELRIIYKADRCTDIQRLKMERLRDALPLHHAALTLMDEELKAFFIAHADDEIGWDRVTNSEATLLHLTVYKLKPLSTRWLLESVHHADSWKTARDIDGYTPLEALQENLETMRTQKLYGFCSILNTSDHFKGYPDAAVSCLSLLLGQDTLMHSGAYLRYGCTCGGCVEGFLSARMRSSLIFQGETKYDLSQDHIDDGRYWVEYNDDILVHLDPDVRKNLKTNKSIRKGFVNMFQTVVECLKAKKIPTTENLVGSRNIQTEWPPDTKNYLQRVGVQMGSRAVVRHIFDTAKDQDEKAGDGEFQRIMKKEWLDLPTCRNDHEFEFVARLCGYSGDDFV